MQAHFREAGFGPGVICLHSNASNSGQWRGLMELLAPRFRVFAPDSYGAGKSPPWPAGRAGSLADELDLIEPVLQKAGIPLALVGHSYGAAIALVAAVRNPARVRALALYEPTLFSLVDAQSPPPNDVDGIRNAVARASAALDAGDRSKAAEHFIDFWAGAGAWARAPEARKPAIEESIVNIKAWGQALLSEPTPLSAFAQLDVPVLYMMGRDSPPSSRSVGRLLTRVLPRVELVEFDGVAHMGPLTHAERINAAIANFLTPA